MTFSSGQQPPLTLQNGSMDWSTVTSRKVVSPILIKEESLQILVSCLQLHYKELDCMSTAYLVPRQCTLKGLPKPAASWMKGDLLTSPSMNIHFSHHQLIALLGYGTSSQKAACTHIQWAPQ